MSPTKLLSFNEAISLFEFSLRALGILPSTFVGSYILTIYFVTSAFVDSTMFIADAIVKRATSVDVVYESLGSIGINLRFYILLAKRREFSELLETCAELWNYCDVNTQSLVINFERKIRLLFWVILISIGFGVNILYSITAIKINYFTTENINATKVLPFRWYGVENPESVWPGFKLTFLMQNIVIYNAALISATVDSALPLLTVLCCGYFQVLREKIRNINDKSDGDLVLSDYELINCCKFHQKILNVCSRVESLGRLIFLVELVSSGYILGLTVVKLASSDPEKYKCLPIICILATHILICQWPADLLKDESKEVSTAVYSVSCTFMQRPSSKHVIIMILRAQQPLIMTAGGIVILSLNNFGKMLTSAISLCTTMRNLMD